MSSKYEVSASPFSSGTIGGTPDMTKIRQVKKLIGFCNSLIMKLGFVIQ